jgi:uncharacterized membrane protein
MVYYLLNYSFINTFFIISNIIIIYALYLADISLLLKLIISILAITLNYRAFLANNFIKAFYLSINKNKSILLTKNNTEIKVNFIKISYFNTWLLILCFARGTKIFRVVVFRNAVTLPQFKSLQMLARYNFLHQGQII